MVHTSVFRVASDEALDFWTERLGNEGVEVEREGSAIRFTDPEGLALEIAAVQTQDEALIADAAGTLLDLARVQEGDLPRDPAQFARRVAMLLGSSLA